MGVTLPMVSIWRCMGTRKGPMVRPLHPWEHHPLSAPVLSHLHHHSHPVHSTVADYPVESGRHLHDARKDGGRGSGSHLMRAFASSKPLQPASLPAPGLTVPAPYLRRRVSDGCTKQDRQPECHPSHRLGLKLRRTRLRLGQPCARSATSAACNT